MILHANAALSRRQRERLIALVFAGATISAAAKLEIEGLLRVWCKLHPE